jgi:hypothetical protein
MSFPTEFLNWWNDKGIAIFEQSLTPEQLEKFRPYMIMFHVLKLEYKRKTLLYTDDNAKPCQ